ncbi:hypothetical protein H0H87_000791 [Tephrocybe sp. NHM501043]|nr:hypothetical protein H0H87_000791 [Tephrocybe sp. NHM501043]
MEHGTLTGEPVHLKYFDVSDAGFAWRDDLRKRLASRRAAMGDRFIFDILLEGGGVERPQMLFPPPLREDLEILLHAIELSDYDHLKKECLIYYLLKWHQDGREVRFQAERSIPSQFAHLADAYWHLDAGHDIARAVSLLSDRRINGDHASKIIHAISLAPNPSPLIIQYVRSAKPHLRAPFDLFTYTLALAESNLLEAWQYQRTFNETTEMRRIILEKLLEWCISPTPRPAAINTLLSLPLSPFEEKFLHNYALEPPKSLARPAVPLLRDLICVRLIQSGKHMEAVKIDHEFAGSTLNESKNDAEGRRKMVRELYDALPLPERTLLDAELARIAPGKPSESNMNGVQTPKPKPKPKPSSPVKDFDMSQSWEEIPRPPQPLPLNGLAHSRGSLSIPVSASNPLYGLSGSTNGAPPILPVSTTTTTNHPRPSFPFSSSLSSSTSRRPLKFPSIPASSSGTRPAASVAPTESDLFSSASRKPNAFYKPPPANPQQGVKRSFESTLAREMDMDGEDEEIGAEPVQVDHEELERSRQPEDFHDVSEEQLRELGFSVFGNANTKKPAASKKAAAQAPQRATTKQNGRRVPPGAFVSDDENEHENEPEPEPEPERREPTPTPPTRTRTSTRKAQPSRATKESTTRSPEAKRARRSEHPKLKQSVPGALVHSDDDEEEEDHVAPLPSPPRRGAARRVRETTPGSDMGDEETGGQTRRRSSRLTTAGGESTRKTSSSTSAPTAGKAKKTTKTTATKKKR